MPAEDKGDLQKNPKQMHLLSAKKGSGNESSCSFRPPVFFQWRKDETASSGYFFFSPGAGCVCQCCDGRQVYLSWQRWISQQRAGPVQLSCWGGAHTRADIKLFQEVISLLFFTKMPNALDLMLSCTHPCCPCRIDLQCRLNRRRLNKRSRGRIGSQKTFHLSCTNKNSERKKGVEYLKEALTGVHLKD